MRAVILAAGRGSRLEHLTQHRPKCMLEVEGKSLLQRQVDSLRQSGIKRVTALLGYQSTEVHGYGFDCRFVSTWQSHNMVGTLLCADDILASHDCIISYSDIVYPLQMPRHLSAQNADICVMYDTNWYDYWSQRFARPEEDAESFALDDQGRLLAIGDPINTNAPPVGQYMGLIKTTPRGWRHLREAVNKHGNAPSLDLTGLLSIFIRDGGEVHGLGTDAPWAEIDTASDLEIAKERIHGLEQLTREESH